ncbi:MAG: hypothetical protein K8R16_05530 [Anaerolineales bacterium]|nr:hypothetical protein [Anaerolineales bacterium]
MRIFRSINQFGIVIFFLIIFALGACNKLDSENSIAKTPEFYSDLQKAWLDDPYCNPPCWQGITPGFSTKEEALEVLNNIDYLEISSQSEHYNFGAIEWDWKLIYKYDRGGRFFYSLEDELVYAIEPSLIIEIQLNELIERYGEPSYIKINYHELHSEDSEGWYTFRIIWIEDGISIIGAPDNDIMVVDEDFRVLTLTFFTPTLEGYHMYDSLNINEYPWKGYGNIDMYLGGTD